MSISASARRAGSVLFASLLAACADTNTVAPSGSLEIDAANARAGYAPSEGQRQYGTPTTLGDGKVRTYVVTDHRSKTPLEIGVAIDASAMASLPADPQMLHLALPPSAPAPYDFVMFDWNPNGHPPMGVYTRPHFDFHFYTVSEAEVMAIDPSDPAFFTKGANMPTGAMIPAPYFLPPAPLSELIVPGMGIHWSDPTSPEFAGGAAAFTRTFIYGSWDGKFTFLEPMITRDFLTDIDGVVSVNIPQSANMAASFRENGYYPTRYTMTYDEQAREYRVAITGLVYRQQ